MEKVGFKKVVMDALLEHYLHEIPITETDSYKKFLKKIKNGKKKETADNNS